MWQRGYAFVLGVEDGAEKSAENDLGRCDLHGGQVRQVVFERPLRLQLGNVGRQHGVTAKRVDRALTFIEWTGCGAIDVVWPFLISNTLTSLYNLR